MSSEIIKGEAGTDSERGALDSLHSATETLTRMNASIQVSEAAQRISDLVTNVTESRRVFGALIALSQEVAKLSKPTNIERESSDD